MGLKQDSPENQAFARAVGAAVSCQDEGKIPQIISGLGTLGDHTKSAFQAVASGRLSDGNFLVPFAALRAAAGQELARRSPQ